MSNRTLDEIIEGYARTSQMAGFGGMPPEIRALLNYNSGLGSVTPMIPTLHLPQLRMPTLMPTGPLQLPPVQPPPTYATPLLQPPPPPSQVANDVAMLQHQQYVAGAPAYITPSPASLQGGQYGVFRGDLADRQSQGWSLPAIPQLPLHNLLGPLEVDPRFTTDANNRMRIASHRAMMGAEFDQQLTRGLARGSASTVGAFIGGSIGKYVGGLPGSLLGSSLGAWVGSSEPVSAAVDWLYQPNLLRRAHAMRLREASESFYTGGSMLDASGRGMSPVEATRLTRELSGLATGGLNKTDITNITQMSMETGLLDFSRNSEQMVDTIKNVIRAVGAIAKATGDPDTQKALGQVAAMQRMGAGMNQIISTVSSATGYGRIAGVSADSIYNQGGMLGAVTFQGSGLTGAPGVGVGMMSQALARAGIRGGAINAQQLALLSGEEGLTQKINMAMANVMTGQIGHLLLGAVSKQGANGQLTIDSDMALRAAHGGAIDIQKLIGAGSANLTPQKIAQLEMQKKELLDSLSSTLGPTGMLRLLGGIGQGVQRTAGLDSLEQGIHVALGRQDPQLARAISSVLQSPDTLRDMYQQFEYGDRAGRINEASGHARRRGYFGRRWDRLAAGFNSVFTREHFGRDLDIEGAAEEETLRRQAMGQDVLINPLTSIDSAMYTRSRYKLDAGGALKDPTVANYLGFGYEADAVAALTGKGTIRQALAYTTPGQYNVPGMIKDVSSLRDTFRVGLEGAESGHLATLKSMGRKFTPGTLKDIYSVLDEELLDMGENPWGSIDFANFKGNLKGRLLDEMWDKDPTAWRALQQEFKSDPKLLEDLISSTMFMGRGSANKREIYEEMASKAEGQLQDAGATLSMGTAKALAERTEEDTTDFTTRVLGYPGAGGRFGGGATKRAYFHFDSSAVEWTRTMGDLYHLFGGDEEMLTRFALETMGENDPEFMGQLDPTKIEAYAAASSKARVRYRDELQNGDLKDTFDRIAAGRDTQGWRKDFHAAAKEASDLAQRQRLIEISTPILRAAGDPLATINGYDDLLSFIRNNSGEESMQKYASAIRGMSDTDAIDALARMHGTPGKSFIDRQTVDGRGALTGDGGSGVELLSMAAQFGSSTNQFSKSVIQFGQVVNSQAFQTVLNQIGKN